MSGPYSQHPAIGSKVKDKQARAWLPALEQRLYDGERITALSRTNLIRPMADGVVVTTARVTAFSGALVASEKVAVEVFADNIGTVGFQKRFTGKNCLVVTTRDGHELNFGDIPADDAQLVIGAVQQLAVAGMPPEVHRAASEKAAAAAQSDAAWGAVRIVGNRPSDRAWKVVREHAMPGEIPWFVLGADIAGGALAAFEDRCMIIKVGTMTSMMTGSFGGGRITTFPFTDITGVEYNSGMLNGVLEVLTPSYQGSSNKDYWRGSFSSVNSNSDNPWTLSNTLPLGKPLYQQALPLLNELRNKISVAKRPTVTMSPPPSSADRGGGLADEIGKLAALRDQGVLSEHEFQTAKQGLIGRATS